MWCMTHLGRTPWCAQDHNLTTTSGWRIQPLRCLTGDEVNTIWWFLNCWGYPKVMEGLLLWTTDPQWTSWLFSFIVMVIVNQLHHRTHIWGATFETKGSTEAAMTTTGWPVADTGAPSELSTRELQDKEQGVFWMDLFDLYWLFIPLRARYVVRFITMSSVVSPSSSTGCVTSTNYKQLSPQLCGRTQLGGFYVLSTHQTLKVGTRWKELVLKKSLNDGWC